MCECGLVQEEVSDAGSLDPGDVVGGAVNTLGLFSTVQPMGPKLTTPCTSHLSRPSWHSRGPPESP